MKLGTRIHILTTLLVFILLVVTNTAVYLIFKKITIDAEMRQLNLTTNNIIEELNGEEAEDVPIGELLRNNLLSDGMIRIVSKDDTAYFQTATESSYKNIKTNYESQETSKIVDFANSKFAVVSVPTIWNNGEVVSLQVIENIDFMYDNFRSLLMILVVSSSIFIIAAFFAGRVLSTVILTPIQRMTSTMQEIQKSRSFKKFRIKNESKDELYEMAATFNEMMDILHENYYKQQQFVSDASHELKTPLTVIESYAKMLQRWGRKREDLLDESIEAIYSEAQRMKMMTNQMLNLAKSEDMWDAEMKRSNIRPLIEATAKQLSRTYEREIQVSFNKDEHWIPMHEQGIKQLLLILLDNARKYSEKQIDVEVLEEHSTLQISVKDYGMGIPGKELPHIFDRFYRVDKVRSRETGGTGLGLSIAKQIVDAHSGTITVHSEEGKGTTVVFTLNLNEGSSKSE